MTDLVKATSHAEVRQLCQDISAATILPPHFRDKPANVLVALMAADALGVDQFTALQEMFVVNGKIGMSAGLTATLVRKAGHRLRVIESTAETATIEILRADDPEAPFRVTWTMADARRAGLSGASWQKFPAAMLVARATTACARMACAEALSGVAYTKDELSGGSDEDTTDVVVEVLGADGQWADTAYPQTSAAGAGYESARSEDGVRDADESARADAPAPVTDIEDAVVVDEATGEVVSGEAAASPVSRFTGPDDPRLTRRYGTPTATAGKAAITRLILAMADSGIPRDDRDANLAWCAERIGRAIETRNDLTSAEVGYLLDVLRPGVT